MERRRASSPSRRQYRLLLRVYAAENLRHVASQGTFCRVTIEEGETPMRGSARASLKRLLQGSARANALDSSDDPLASSLPPRIVTTQVQKSLHGKPIWNEKFELPVVDVSHEVVHFRIKSARVMSAPIIGGASVMLSDVPTDATMDRWLNLFDSSRKPAGKLRIQMRLSLMSSKTSSSSPRSFPASVPSPVLRPRSSTASAMATTTTTEERDTYYQHPRRTSYVSPTALPRSNRRGAIIAPPIGGVATFRQSSTLSRSMLEMRASGSTTASDSISSDHSHPNDSVVAPYTPSFNDSFVETPTASSSPLTNKQRDPPTPTRTPPARSAPAYPRDSDVSFASSRFTGLSDRGRSTASAAVRDTDVSRVSSRFTGLSDRGRSTPSASVRDTDVSRASSRFTGYSGHDRSTTAFSTSSRDTELDDLANKYMIKPTRETTINPVPEEPEASRRSSRAASASRDDSYASLKASFTMPKAVPDTMAMPESAWESSWETPSPVGRASSMMFGESEKESPDTWELTQPGRKKSTAVAPSTANPDTGNTWEWETLSPRWSSDTVPSPIEKPVRQDPSAVHGASKKSMPVPVPVPVPVVAPPVPMVAPSVPVPVSISASLSVPSARVSKPKASRGSAEETPSPRVAKPSASQETPATRELSRREQRTSQQIMPNELEDFLHGEDPVESGRGQPVSMASSPSSSSSPSGPSLSDIKRHVSSSKKVVAPDSKTSSSSQAGAGAIATTNNSPSPKDERSPRTTNTTARGSNEDGEDLGETIEFDFDTGDVRPSKRLPSHMMRSTMSRSSIASSRMMSDGDESGIDHDDDGYDSDDSEDEPEDDEMDPDGDPDGPRMVLRSTVTWLLGRDSVNVIMDVDEEDEDYDDFDPFVFDDFPLLDMNDTTFLIKDIDYADRTAAAS